MSINAYLHKNLLYLRMRCNYYGEWFLFRFPTYRAYRRAEKLESYRAYYENLQKFEAYRKAISNNSTT